MKSKVHVRDNKKIELLAKRLLKEIENQGYSIESSNELCNVSLYVFKALKNNLTINNHINHWEIDCGTYQPRVEKVAQC